jgi:hypothetical protein
MLLLKKQFKILIKSKYAMIIIKLRRCYMKNKNFCLIFIIIFGLFSVSLFGTISAADEDTAKEFSPILYFEKDETCFPVDISYHIDNSYLYQVDVSQPIDMNPSEETLSNYSMDEYYLDNQKGTVNDNGIINDYQNSKLDSYTVYARVSSLGGSTIIQYWMFYAFNPGTMNQHEGDWEMVQVIISGGIPEKVMYSQHHNGQIATWDQIEKEGNHVKVYVSRGSHANYMRPYSGMVGVANDIVGDGGKRLTSSDYDIVMLESQSWLDYAGRWGWYGTTEEEAEKSSLLGQAGPNGPKFREEGTMWDNPLGWGDTLFQADNNIFILELFLYNFILIFTIIAIIIICLMVFQIHRRRKKTGLGPRIISIFYIDGINTKSIGNILCIIGIILALYSLIIPWYAVTSDIGISGYETEGMADVITVDGIQGIQIQVPGLTGPMPMGSVTIPFSLLIGIGLVFLFINSVGISESKKLGKKYIFRGVRLFVPFVFILIIILSLSAIPFESMVETGESGVNVQEIISSISGSPFGGQRFISITGVDGQIELQWGYGLGGYLLLLSGIILIISGIIEIKSDALFFGKKIEKSSKKKQEEPDRNENKLKLEDMVEKEDDKQNDEIE